MAALEESVVTERGIRNGTGRGGCYYAAASGPRIASQGSQVRDSTFPH